MGQRIDDIAVGTKVTLVAKLGARDEFLDKICLVNVRTPLNEVFSDHEWIIYDRDRLRNLMKGDYIKFTAYVTEYKGMDDGNYVTKKGLRDIRNVQRLK